MCAQRIQRLLTAVVLSIVLLLFLNSYILYAAILQGFVIVMMLLWGLFNFCPALWFLKKIFPPCEESK